MNFTSDELAELENGTQRIGLFFRMATTTPVCLWLGVGRIEPGTNLLDITGTTYYGFGELLDVPSFQQLVGGASERVEFSLSGVSAKVLALAGLGISGIQFCDVAVGIAILNRSWQLLAPIHWTWRGKADFIRKVVVGGKDPSTQTTYTIILSVGSLMSGRRRRGFAYWTDQDQQARSPGDKFCERTVAISEIAQKAWPRY